MPACAAPALIQSLLTPMLACGGPHTEHSALQHSATCPVEAAGLSTNSLHCVHLCICVSSLDGSPLQSAPAAAAETRGRGSNQPHSAGT